MRVRPFFFESRMEFSVQIALLRLRANGKDFHGLADLPSQVLGSIA